MSAAQPAEDEAPWCSHPECYDRIHADSTHLDEDGRPFRRSPADSVAWSDADPP